MATDFNIQLPPAENTPTFRIVKTLASSIKPLGDRTVMMLNKDGFVKAFNEAEPHFPTREEAVRVRNYIFFQLQQHYQKKGKTFLFRDWLTEHNLLDIFFVNESTQKERYQKPIEREAKLETKLHNLECSIVVKCLALFHEGNRVAKPDFFRDNASSLDSLSKTERVINASVGSRDQLRKAQARIRDLEIDTQPAFNTTFTTSNDGEQSTDMVNMYYGLWGTEYYLRKASGTYIFRYMSPDLTKWFEMYNNTNHFAEMELDLLDLGYELPVPSATSDAGGYFVYSGLVPRHQKEYLGRLTDITGRVVHILLAILTYCNSHATAASKEVLAEMLARRETITPMDIFTLEWYWQFYLPKEETFPEDIRKVVRESPVVTEFVTLLTLISSPTPRESPHLVKLLDLLQYATGWKVGEFVEKEDERQSAMAFEAFQRADREESCLVFSDEVYKDIHSFYSTPSYENDPYHSKFFYRNNPREALKNLTELLESANQLYEDLRAHVSSKAVSATNSQGPVEEPRARQTAQRPRTGKRRRSSAALSIRVQNTATAVLIDGSGSLPTPPATPAASNSPELQQSTEQSAIQPPPVKRGRGRPRGSKNKVKKTV